MLIEDVNQDYFHTNINKPLHIRRDILKNLDAVMAQSHISITETRWVIVNSTHFCNAWLAIIGV